MASIAELDRSTIEFTFYNNRAQIENLKLEVEKERAMHNDTKLQLSTLQSQFLNYAAESEYEISCLKAEILKYKKLIDEAMKLIN